MLKNNVKYVIRYNKRLFSTNLSNNNIKDIEDTITNNIDVKANLFDMIHPYNIYLKTDTLIRTYIDYLSNNLELGYGLGIICASISLKLILSPIMFKFNKNKENMAKIKPDMDNYRNKMIKYYTIKDMENFRKTKKELNEFLKNNGVNNKIYLFMILQMYLYGTWFFSLKWMLSNPDIYNNLKGSTFLWSNDLCLPDNYYVFPLILSALNFLNITVT